LPSYVSFRFHLFAIPRAFGALETYKMIQKIRSRNQGGFGSFGKDGGEQFLNRQEFGGKKAGMMV
jgi:hypothetical protein